MSTEEQWKVIPGFSGYEASDRGSVRRAIDGAVVRQNTNGRGYLSVSAKRDDGKWVSLLVHRAVALAHIGMPPEGKPSVLHADDVKGNNHVSNLRWGDNSENMTDASANGCFKYGARGLACSRGHFRMPWSMTDAGQCYACLQARTALQMLRKRYGLDVEDREGALQDIADWIYGRMWDGEVGNKGLVPWLAADLRGENPPWPYVPANVPA